MRGLPLILTAVFALLPALALGLEKNRAQADIPQCALFRSTVCAEGLQTYLPATGGHWVSATAYTVANQNDRA